MKRCAASSQLITNDLRCDLAINPGAGALGKKSYLRESQSDGLARQSKEEWWTLGFVKKINKKKRVSGSGTMGA